MFKLYPFVHLLGIWSVSGLIMPITKSDGSLDITSLMSHLTLVEHSIEAKASAQEVAQLKADLNVAQREAKDTKTELATVKADLATSAKEVTQLKSDFTTSQRELTRMKSELEITTTELRTTQADLKKADVDIAVVKNQLAAHQSPDYNKGGTTFTRWGRTTCPAASNVVYKGFTGGTYHTNKASAANILCLPDEPIYGFYTTTGHSNITANTHGSTIFGTEYASSHNKMYFHNMNNEDMPCVVCESGSNSISVMVPGRNICFPGWSLEYAGYLMGPGDVFASGEFICVDSNPEAIPGGSANDNGQILFSVEGKCGSLPCPPYHDNWELTCVVCSK